MKRHFVHRQSDKIRIELDNLDRRMMRATYPGFETAILVTASEVKGYIERGVWIETDANGKRL